MNEVISTTSAIATRGEQGRTLPAPRIAIGIRAGEMRDLPFIDSLQRMHTNQVGFMPLKALEGKIKLGHILIAESNGERVAYLMGNDQYNKRDDLGIIFQMNVLPGKQRGLIGSSLLKAQFERSAWGCKLYCCWCAQDLAANKFWEACGFVPIAFRTGARKKGKNAAGKSRPRMHIFWQKRIREGDTTTPWWFPSQTGGGAMMEDRLVFPIPSGVHWSDAMPVVLPGAEERGHGTEIRKIAGPRAPRAKSKLTSDLRPLTSSVSSGGLRFAVASEKPAEKEKPKREPKAPRVKQKNDPKYVAAARELRDRWLERVNADASSLLCEGKYDVSRQLASPFVRAVSALPTPVTHAA